MIAKRGRNTGQALVEFALVIPLMLLFIFAIVDFGRVIYMYSVLSDVAREGARYAIVHGSLATGGVDPQSGPGTSDPTGSTYVVPAAKAVAFGLNPSSVRVGVCWGFDCTVPADCSAGSSTALSPIPDVTVKVRACYNFQAIVTSAIPVGPIPLSAQAALVVTH
jgi:TadE-like protein